MPEKKNALAKLAESIERFTAENKGLFASQTHLMLYRAQRIVAELAKVVDCKEPERIMPFDEPYDDITLYAPYDNGLTESNSINEDEKRFILDLANVAWNCRKIAEEGGNDAD